MQLILETESMFDVEKKMTTIREPLDEKVMVNGDVEDLKDKKCNGNKENLVDDDILTAGEVCTKVNVQITDDYRTKRLANVEGALLDNNCEALENHERIQSSESCAQNDEITAPIPDSHTNNGVNFNNSGTNQIAELKGVDLKHDNILSTKDGKDIISEVFHNAVMDTENEVEKEFDIDEENPVSKEDIHKILEKIASVSSDDPVDIDTRSESLQNDDSNKINNTQASESLTKDTEIAIQEDNKLDMDGPENMEQETTNEIHGFPDLLHEEKDSEPMECKDEINEEKVVVEQNNGNCDVANPNKEQVKSEIIELKEETGATVSADAVMKDTSDTCELVSEHKLGVIKPEEIAEDVKNEVFDGNQNAQSNRDSLAPSASSGDVQYIADVSKSDTCCMFQFPKLDEGMEQTSTEVHDVMEVEEIKDVQENIETKVVTPSQTRPASPAKSISENPVSCRLLNTLDILSDDDEEPPSKESQPLEVKSQTKELASTQQQSINIEDDDDIMVIDEEPIETELNKHVEKENSDEVRSSTKPDSNTDMETGEECNKHSDDLFSNNNEKESTPPAVSTIVPSMDIDIKDKPFEKEPDKYEPEKPLLSDNFLLSAKKNLADMTREDLEEFCILKIVESIVDRSSLSDIKSKLKAMTQNIEEFRKKAMTLTKQNRDLQVVLKSVQEEQKKMTDLPINPLKITRSVGMQVLMTDKFTMRRKTLSQAPNIPVNNANRQTTRPTGVSPRIQKPATSNQTIPVPRLVPANSPVIKSPSAIPIVPTTNNPGKTCPSPVPNGIKSMTPAQKAAEKRQHNRIQSVTVDLTDDEPPAKINPRNSPAPPVRLVPPLNLMPPQRQPFTPAAVNSPRKVYIPISGPQTQAIRAGHAIMLKSVAGTRPKCPPPQPPRLQNPLRRVTSGRHPAPLPDAMKQYQPPNWKALPPAPDLRLSKVENGIVISWKIEGYQVDSYEEIASYQLYAYQETSSPPSTTLWKKIGDVKALPLPMACTLTQFMAGFKYYFAVRAVDVKSRLGPFSLPGSILLLNKL